MYQRSDLGLGGAAALSFDARLAAPIARDFGRRPATGGLLNRLDARLAAIDFAPDLGADIGSRDWWRGLATCTGLIATAWALSPGFAPIRIISPPIAADTHQEARALAIAPLALGADTGKRMAATDAVIPLMDTPERPSIDLVATIGQGDGFARVLTRAGVGEAEARRIAEMVAGVVAPGDIKSGTRMDVTLGRRPNRQVSRPLDFLALRARFDLRIQIERIGGALAMQQIPIAIDRTPLRIQGLRGESLVTTARAAGVPAKTIEAYLKALSSKMSMSDLRADDKFDIIVDHARAETGEVQVGELLYAGLDQGRKKLQLMQFTSDGRTEWFEASGVGKKRGSLGAPVSGRMTSGFGMRRHPLLGYSRFHKGMDFGAPHGAPIHAVSDGVVVYAGRKGGYGNFVGINHAGGLGTGYGHMSRIAVSPGSRVRQGQVIGYVGSTGMSTGPHLHYELYKNGRAINPRSVSFTTTSQLTGNDLAQFRAKLARLLAVPPGVPGPAKPVSRSAAAASAAPAL